MPAFYDDRVRFLLPRQPVHIPSRADGHAHVPLISRAASTLSERNGVTRRYF